MSTLSLTTDLEADSALLLHLFLSGYGLCSNGHILFIIFLSNTFFKTICKTSAFYLVMGED
jgi:hypothetical protein